MLHTVRFHLNGTAIEVPRCPDDATALGVLRERCGILSLKDGCSPQGQCGACVALVGGTPKVTCAMPAARLEGLEVSTIEGLPAADRELLSRSFVAAAGVQCGFCIPGLLLRTAHLLQRPRKPSRAEIATAIDVHLCRCTGYVKILDAIELAFESKRSGTLPAPVEDGRVGQRLARYEGRALALGQRPYVDDLRFEGMLEAAVVLSPHARATVRRIDTSEAAREAGVVCVATARDVPGERWYGLLHADWPGFIAENESTRCVGDVLAVVAAVDRATARRAAAKVRVDFDVHRPITDPVEALRPGCPQINPKHGNLLGHSRIARGDAAAALAASAHVVARTWRTQRVEHLYLEPESCVAVPRGGGVRVYSQGQGIFDDQRQIASFLRLAVSEVEVELVPNGGAFGGKEDMSVQAHTALLARLTGRPVKLTLSREESIRMHPKRHPITMEYTVGCDAEGRLTAVKARMIGDSGAYASVGAKVLERAAGHACGAYRVPNVEVEAYAAYTNNPPCGAFRGFGANQAQFAMEGAIDMLAEKVGLDRWQMRYLNALEVGDTFSSGQILEKSVGLKRTLLAVKEAYDAARSAGRAVGIACGIKNSGIGNGVVERGKARIRVERDGTVSLFNGFTEMGQGLMTVLIQCAVEVTRLPASVFRARVDTTYPIGCGQTTGSRGTLLGGRAVKAAAEQLRGDLDAGYTLSDLADRMYAGDVTIDDTTPLGAVAPKIKTHTSFGFATQLVILDERGRIERVIAAHDVGRAINPALCEGQIEGAVHMGLGYALSEELPCKDGMPITKSMREIGALRARDMPEVTVVLVEDPEPEGPFGAKGVGEIGLVPTAGAVAGALAAFDGVRRFELPMKASPAAQAIHVGRIKNRPEGCR